MFCTTKIENNNKIYVINSFEFNLRVLVSIAYLIWKYL